MLLSGYNIACSGRRLTTFRRYLLPPSSEHKVCIHFKIMSTRQITRCYRSQARGVRYSSVVSGVHKSRMTNFRSLAPHTSWSSCHPSGVYSLGAESTCFDTLCALVLFSIHTNTYSHGCVCTFRIRPKGLQAKLTLLQLCQLQLILLSHAKPSHSLSTPNYKRNSSLNRFRETSSNDETMHRC
jgi:hypothetical protein